MLKLKSKMKHTKGERLNIHLNRKIRLEFHGARLTSNGDLLADRKLDEASGLLNYHVVHNNELLSNKIRRKGIFNR